MIWTDIASFMCIFAPIISKQTKLVIDMRKRRLSFLSSGALFCLLISSSLISCIDKDTNLSISGEENSNTPHAFNFSTTESVQLNVNYDVPEGYKVLFEVYTENPFVTDESGQVVKRTDIDPVIKRMTDEKGAYSSLETISSDHGNDVYIYTSCIGVPMLHKASFDGAGINADINWDTMADAASRTRADGEYQNVPSGFYTLGTWDVNGRPNYLDSEGELTLSASVINTINKTIPERGNCPQEYRQSVDFVLNDPNGKMAEVKVRFIGGTSSAASAFGYYCYKEGDSDEAIRKAKKYVIFPNTRTGVGIKGGECVKLHYIDENGVDQGTEFPNGTKIGWFIKNNAFKQGTVGAQNKEYYSTTSLNSDKRTHTAAFRINDFIVLSFEDWTDSDYNDVQFNVWSNPIEAIVTPELPDVEPSEPEDDGSVAYRMSYKGILAFEDNWPSKGDYDLNDMIVRYNSTLSFNTKNEVLSTEDEFKVLWAGALYRNGFAYQMNTERSNVECEILEGASDWGYQGLDKDLTQATVSLFNDAKEVTGENTRTPAYKVINTFKKPVDHNRFGVAPYNPFIFIHKNASEGRVEVHPINHKPTEKADMTLFHTEVDLSDVEKGVYYVSANSYPFAIHLIDAEEFSTKEGVSVDKSYPKYTDWAKSNGMSNKDWYKK